ncbi:MAG: hypothetical protein CVT48_06495 [Thermoplasmata archaeon HGW-Thermoplasmata-1]|nr:MAG: hypothetical protein CVT48_06495 [Thermoplasmata archaeon HGW-Thermoplasmata-1]
MVIDPSTTKYLIKAHIKADGVIEKPDVIGAVFGQTEGLLGNELDLRDLQKGARVGRIEVEIDAKKGKSEGEILLPSSLDKVETAILAAALESIDRVGPCKAQITVTKIEDTRVIRRQQIVERAKQLLSQILRESETESADITSSVRDAVQVEEIVFLGPDKVPAGPNVATSDDIIIVEGRNDVLNLLKNGIKNAVAVEGTNVPQTVIDLCKERTVTAFVDGDRGGELILKELFQVAEIDFVARAPKTREVEEIPQKLVMKALKNKISADHYAEMYGLQAPKEVPIEEISASPVAMPQRGSASARKEMPQKEPVPQQQPREQREGRRPEGRRGEERQRDEGSERRERREPREERRTAAVKLSPEQETFKGMLASMAGSLKAVILDKDNNEIEKDVPVRDLAEKLKKSKTEIGAVVFDGVITQRILDIAVDKGIKTVVGAKKGNITKQPVEVTVLAGEEFN